MHIHSIYKQFSEKTDVWAFAVLMWEIFARNQTPYAEMKSQEVKRFLDSGGRLEQIKNCGDSF